MLARALFTLLAASLAAAAPHYKLNRRSDGLSVQLFEAGPAQVKAVLTNSGGQSVHVLTLGTFLDASPVQSFSVSQNGELVPYTGIMLNYKIEDLPEDDFITLQPGQSAESVVSLPEFYSMTGGSYTVSIADTFAYAPEGSGTLEGVYAFESNELTLEVDPESIASISTAVAVPSLEARSQVVSCSGTQLTAVRNGISVTNRLAASAANAASSGSSTKFNEYFRTTASSTRSNVASRFRSVASEAASSTSGRTSFSCVDFAGVCSNRGVIAYAQPSSNRMAACPPFFSLPAVSSRCDQASQASTVLHELTHCSAIVSPNTVDYAYGYSASTRLTAAQAYQNADTYALYADAIANGC